MKQLFAPQYGMKAGKFIRTRIDSPKERDPARSALIRGAHRPFESLKGMR